MKNSGKGCFQPFFSHIYVEKRVAGHPRTKEILAKFPSAAVIEISHYKDVFCRSGQNCTLQHRSQKLILAKKEGSLLYRGSPVCQSFGNENFYYASCIMNCIYDCEYCYLKGMYPSANLVVFVNLEDMLAQAERMLESQSLYLCVSYDTDLLALEAAAGYAKAWCRFAERHPDRLKIEIRTKCANDSFFETCKVPENVVFAFTLSPQAAVEQSEHGTPPLSARISCAGRAVRAGASVRLCFDPVLYVPGWKAHYDAMLEEVFRCMEMEKLADVSVGTFRIARDYLKKMRKQAPDSPAAWFPYQLENGFYQYPDGLRQEMEQYLVEKLKTELPEDKIFLWKES
ncbi:MAG: radical SAM protein [Eubacterium sp.]|nr:radical SAM protein [Eubacterium sp.]